jgi:hypothetical protein
VNSLLLSVSSLARIRNWIYRVSNNLLHFQFSSAIRVVLADFLLGYLFDPEDGGST